MGFKPLTLNTPPEEEAHVLAEDDAAIFQSIFGKDGVFETGDRMKATVINNNQVRVSNGVICVGGHIGRTEYGDYSDMIIENGEISKNRNDIIMAVFSTTGKTGIDEFKIEVKKGTPGIAAEDPEIVKGDLYEGSKIREFPLWRVKLEGINIVGVEKMFNAIPTIPELEEKIELLNGNIRIEKFSADEIGINSPVWKVIFSNVYKQNGVVHFMAQAYTTAPTVANAEYTVFNLPEELKPSHNDGVTATASDVNGNNACACYSNVDTSGALKVKIPNSTCKYVILNAIWFTD